MKYIPFLLSAIMLATGVAVISSCLLSPNRGNPQNIKTDGEMYITGFPVVKLKNVEATSLTPTFIIEPNLRILQKIKRTLYRVRFTLIWRNR